MLGIMCQLAIDGLHHRMALISDINDFIKIFIRDTSNCIKKAIPAYPNDEVRLVYLKFWGKSVSKF
jgi:hypothetical protein